MKVFISYSRHDEDAVRSMVGDLQRARVHVWLDDELGGGDAWWTEILRQIRECTVFLLALSENSLYSKPCRAELGYAQALGLPILPVQIGEVSSYRADPIFSKQLVDYRKPTAATGFALMGALNEHASQRTDMPDPLPEAPPIPYEYLQRLGASIHDPAMLTPAVQAQLVFELRNALDDEDDPTVLGDIRNLLRTLRGRNDVTARIEREIDTIPGNDAPDLSQTSAGSGSEGVATVGTAPEAPTGKVTAEDPSPSDAPTGDKSNAVDADVKTADSQAPTASAVEVSDQPVASTAKPPNSGPAPNEDLTSRPVARACEKATESPASTQDRPAHDAKSATHPAPTASEDSLAADAGTPASTDAPPSASGSDVPKPVSPAAMEDRATGSLPATDTTPTPGKVPLVQRLSRRTKIVMAALATLSVIAVFVVVVIFRSGTTTSTSTMTSTSTTTSTPITMTWLITTTPPNVAITNRTWALWADGRVNGSTSDRWTLSGSTLAVSINDGYLTCTAQVVGSQLNDGHCRNVDSYSFTFTGVAG